MPLNRILTSSVACLLLATFSAKSLAQQAKSQQLATPTKSAVLTPARDYTNAVLWQQYSGEYKALCFQAYRFAKLALIENLQRASDTKKNCVVVDIDETVLNNAPFQGGEIKKGYSFKRADWTQWTSLGQADTVPGALKFLKYASDRDLEIFYITNRDLSDKVATIKNLQHFGFPNADEKHVLVMDGTSDKESRRQEVLKNYHILLLCGDNLSDFSNIFYRENKDLKQMVSDFANEFGTRFIVLPNPMYGDWEKQLYPAGNLTEAQRSQSRLEKLKGY